MIKRKQYNNIEFIFDTSKLLLVLVSESVRCIYFTDENEVKAYIKNEFNIEF